MDGTSERAREVGVLGELARTPLCADLTRIWLRSLGPAEVRAAVRDLLLGDPEQPLAVLSSLPAALNGLVGALTEVGLALEGKASPALAAGLLESLRREVDGEALAELVRVWRRSLGALWRASPELRRQTRSAVATRGGAALGAAVDGLARAINAAHREDRAVVRRFVETTLDRIDPAELESAAKVLADALVDEARRDLLGGAWNVVSGAVRRRVSETAAAVSPAGLGRRLLRRR